MIWFKLGKVDRLGFLSTIEALLMLMFLVLAKYGMSRRRKHSVVDVFAIRNVLVFAKIE